MLADADLGEERLVGQASVLVVAAGVDASDVAGEGEAVVDVVAGFGVVVVVLGEAVVDRCLLGAEPVLELGELFEADRVLQVRFEEPVLLVDVRRPSLGELGGLGAGGFGEAVEFVVEHAA
ncbi:hypothetical protein G3N30_08215 [Microbacterium lacticum]|uniref:hypothetical protein n=1 Tax=Microbacterium lacticum TaxID=33885 RepID=UPI0018B0EC79|nr:hypothetical protein [Microbacterium lacticum]MBF9336208.1 hypothetical protein [Microbacterium lacticum]